MERKLLLWNFRIDQKTFGVGVDAHEFEQREPWRCVGVAAGDGEVHHASKDGQEAPGVAGRLGVGRIVGVWPAPLPYPYFGVGFPSDTNLYLMLSLAEYVTATRDFGFLDKVLPFYPREDGKTGTVMDHMKLAWRHQIEDVGVGTNGLIKLRNSDWNDSFIAEEKSIDKNLALAQTEAEAQSVLNTAMATYILPRFADLIRAHGQADWANEVDAQAEKFREAVRGQWNGRWYNRALLPNGKAIGADRIYLSLQPWAILGGVPTAEEELILDDNLYHELSSRSPIGAVMRWPPVTIERLEKPGTATNGGVWYSLRFPLIMAYARQRPDYAWEEFTKMTNLAHAKPGQALGV